MRRFSLFSLMLIVLCTLSFGACASKTPLERTIEARTEYTATLNSFSMKETPSVDPAAEIAADVEMTSDAEGGQGEDAEVDAESVDAEGMDGDEEAVELAPEMRQDAVLDVLIQHDSRAPLAGVTVDITMADGSQNELASWRRWIDTEGLLRANQRPVIVVLEDVSWEEGFGFSVEVRPLVPEGERGEYREFEGL